MMIPAKTVGQAVQPWRILSHHAPSLFRNIPGDTIEVLEIVVGVTKPQRDMNSEGLLVGNTGDISFVEEGKEPRPRTLKYGVAKLFGDYLDWKILADLEEKMVFPQHIAGYKPPPRHNHLV